MRHGFSGIGGFDLAAERLGWENIFQVEKDSFCQKILAQHFPHATRFDDVKTFDGKAYANKIDILTGGFPCQPFSSAGKRAGKDDERYLWDSMLRIVREIQPGWVLGENVYGLLTMQDGLVFEQMLLEMENIGYEVQPFVIPAAGVGAPHRRDRVWIIAHANSNATNIKSQGNSSIPNRQNTRKRHKTNKPSEFDGNIETYANAIQPRPQGQNELRDFFTRCSWKQVEPTICGSYNGVSRRLDRIKALGNAIVPQIAYRIFQAIQYVENNK